MRIGHAEFPLCCHPSWIYWKGLKGAEVGNELYFPGIHLREFCRESMCNLFSRCSSFYNTVKEMRNNWGGWGRSYSHSK